MFVSFKLLCDTGALQSFWTVSSPYLIHPITLIPNLKSSNSHICHLQPSFKIWNPNLTICVWNLKLIHNFTLLWWHQYHSSLRENHRIKRLWITHYSIIYWISATPTYSFCIPVMKKKLCVPSKAKHMSDTSLLSVNTLAHNAGQQEGMGEGETGALDKDF